MSDPRMAAVLAAIAERYPGVTIEVRPNPDPDTADGIPHYVLVLDAPREVVNELDDYALDLAFDVYGNDPIPFLLHAVDPENTAKCYRRPVAAERISEP